jgi:uncharacterized repeat protein (TIGR01451 family)
MNSRIDRLFWLPVVAAAQLALAPALQAQLLYRHDNSGNLTSVVSSATTPVGGAVTNFATTLAAGEQLSLSAMGSGSGPLTYQWRLNGNNITGATNATYHKPNASTGDAGTYSVVVTGATGSTTITAGVIAVLAATKTLYGLAYGQGRFVAVGENGAIVTSTDLVNWAQASSGTENRLESVVFGNNTFVAVGANATILSSANGTSWVVRNAGNTNHLKGVAFGGNLFVAVGSRGTTITSPDGVNWTTRTYDYQRLEAVSYANNRFISVGTGGTIWTSFNGINWYDRTFATNQTLLAVSYGNGRYIAAGNGGLILSSSNATNWFPQLSGTTRNLESILFFNNTFFALGPAGNNLISADGTNWTFSASGTFDYLFASVTGNGIPVAAGQNGTVIRIPYSLLDRFTWSAISSPKRMNQSFTATITAKDGANNTLTSFNGTATLSATSLQTLTNSILNNANHSGSFGGTNTVGYSFTPQNDLLVSHFRHYFGKRVSIWKVQDGSFDLLAALNVTSNPGTWVATALSAPLLLEAGTTYILASYTETDSFYRLDGSRNFADGTIDQNLLTDTNALPILAIAAQSFLVDLTYVVHRKEPITFTPATAAFNSGVANVNVSIGLPGEDVVLKASGPSGQMGFSNPFQVHGTNDLAVTVAANPSPATLLSNLTYTVTVRNSGPNSSTSVKVTNTIPASTSYVSAIPSQGSCSFANGIVTCNLGTVGSLGSATVSIIVTPSQAGVMLTNTVSVGRTEFDSNLLNNSATTLTYVPPIMDIYDTGVVEGNYGTTNAPFLILLSSPSVLTVSFDATTLNGSALAGSDYTALQGRWFIPPGSIGAYLGVPVHGDTVIELDETFHLQIANSMNATIRTNAATCTITNDDGNAGQIHYLTWNTIPPVRRVNSAFSTTIRARDPSGIVATTFSGTNVTIRGINIGGPASQTILTNEVHSSSDNLGLFTLGYEFTVNTNLFVTHLRHLSAAKWNSRNAGGLKMDLLPLGFLRKIR